MKSISQMIVYHKISYGQLVKLALETRHFFYRLIIALTLSQNLRRRLAIRSNTENVARTHSQRFCKRSEVFFDSNVGTSIAVLSNSISTASSCIHWGYRSHLILGSVVMTEFRNEWLEFSMNLLLFKRGVWSTIALQWLAKIETPRKHCWARRE